MPSSLTDPTPRQVFDRQVALLGVGHLLAFIDRTKIVGLMPAIRHHIAMTDTAAGWVLGTAFAVGYAVCIVATLAVDRRRAATGGRWRLAAGVALWGLAGMATGLATSITTLIVARALVGAGQALFIPAAVGLLTIEGERVGDGARGLSRFTAAASLGRSTGLFAVAVVLAGIGAIGVSSSMAWRWVFAATTLPNAILLWRVVRLPHAAGAIAPAASLSSGYVVRGLYLLFVLLPFILVQGLAGWLPMLFVGRGALGTQGGAAWAGVVALVGGVSSQLLTGVLLQRMARWHGSVPVLMAGGLTATVPAMALLAWGGTPALATIGALWATLTLGAATFAALFGWQRLIPVPERVAANGVYFALITVVGVGVGPLLTGILVDGGLALGGALFAMTTAGAIVAMLAAIVIQPLYRRHAAV